MRAFFCLQCIKVWLTFELSAASTIIALIFRTAATLLLKELKDKVDGEFLVGGISAEGELGRPTEILMPVYQHRAAINVV